MKSFKNIKITVISSFAEDEVFYAESKKTEILKGGPALWITKALESLNYAPQIFTGKDNAKVKITRENSEESGSVVSVEPIILPGALSADLFIISTISDEFDLAYIKKINGIVALDGQGFVRKSKSRNMKMDIPEDILEKICILKLTKEEARFTTIRTLDGQKNRILLITDGSRGFVIYANNKKYAFEARKINPIDTIGAGDTFFTAFCVRYSEKRKIEDVAMYAKEYTEKFLCSKDTDLIKIENQISGSVENINDAKESNKKILLMTYVHGDEPIGYDVVKSLVKKPTTKKFFDWIVVNQKAALASKRYLEYDMNRIAPGNPDAEEYEMRRANEVIKIVKHYKYVIDIHQTRANNRTIIILSHATPSSIALALTLGIPDILIWENPTKKEMGPLIKDTPFSLGLEIGTKSNYGKSLRYASRILSESLSAIDKDSLSKLSEEIIKKKRFYRVVGKIEDYDIAKGTILKDFKEIDGIKEKFTALLFGRHQNILGYKMQRLDINSVMRYIKN